jgi:hypothetical protein
MSPERLLVKAPKTFTDLIAIAEMHGQLSLWTEMPQIMTFPELSGYNWHYKWHRWELPPWTYAKYDQDDDNRLVINVVFASL